MISPHGAALVNVVFMRPGSHLIELWPGVSRGFLSKRQADQEDEHRGGGSGENAEGQGGGREYEYLASTLGVRYTAAAVGGSWGSRELGVDNATLAAIERAVRGAVEQLEAAPS